MNLYETAEQALKAMEKNLWAVVRFAPNNDAYAYDAAINALYDALGTVESTHSDECYQWHHACAIKEVLRLRAVKGER